MRWIYLLLAIWGALHPMYYFVSWFNSNGFDLIGMINAWHLNTATSGLVWDLTVAAAALTLWIVFETIQTRVWLGFLAIPATFFVGVGCGLPLYLFLRSAGTNDAL